MEASSDGTRQQQFFDDSFFDSAGVPGKISLKLQSPDRLLEDYKASLATNERHGISGSFSIIDSQICV